MYTGAVGPHRDAAIVVIAADGIGALQRACGLFADPEFALFDDIRIFQTLLHLAGIHVKRADDIGRNTVGRAVGRTILEALVARLIIRVDDSRGIRLDGFRIVEYVRQHFIFHVDQLDCLFRQLLGFRRDQRHGLAGQEGTVGCQYGRLGELIPVDAGLIARQDVQHAFQRLRLGDVQLFDVGMRVGASLCLDMRQIGELVVEVAGIQTLTGNLIICIDTLFAFTDQVFLLN